MPVLGLGAEFNLLPPATRVGLRTICFQGIERAMFVVHVLSDEFHVLLRESYLLPDTVRPPSKHAPMDRRSFAVAAHHNLGCSLTEMTRRLDDEVFDVFRDVVEIVEQQRPNELDLASAWINNVYDVCWLSGREILRSLTDLMLALYPEGDGTVDWFEFACNHAAHLHTQLAGFTSDLRYLARILNDFTAVDLREVALDEGALQGLRWSTSTQWPSEWALKIKAASVPVGRGIFEVRSKNTKPTRKCEESNAMKRPITIIGGINSHPRRSLGA
ncbi:hypothetical protein [Nocardia sp. NPDC004722]